MNKTLRFAAFLGLALTTTCLVQCKKDNPPATIPNPGDTTVRQYRPAGKAFVQRPVLYTAGAILTDSATVWQYLQHHAWSTFFTTADSMTLTNKMRIWSLGNNEVALVTNTDSIVARQVASSGNDRVLENTLFNQYQLTPFNETYCDSLQRTLLEARPRRLFEQLNTGPGGAVETWVTSFARYILQSDNQQLTLPMMALGIRSAATNCVLLRTGFWNLPNPTAINQLTTGDTAVIQMSYVVLSRF